METNDLIRYTLAKSIAIEAHVAGIALSLVHLRCELAEIRKANGEKIDAGQQFLANVTGYDMISRFGKTELNHFTDMFPSDAAAVAEHYEMSSKQRSDYFVQAAMEETHKRSKPGSSEPSENSSEDEMESQDDTGQQ
jgi:hypothetical protein